MVRAGLEPGIAGSQGERPQSTDIELDIGTVCKQRRHVCGACLAVGADTISSRPLSSERKIG